MSLTRSGSHITWFLPRPWRWTDPTGRLWHDAGAERNGEGPYASGLPIETAGIAFPNENHTLGGWWRLEFSHLNKTVVVRQVDVGPKKPVVDLSAPLAYELFKTPGGVPDFSGWVATYIGQHPDDAVA